MTSVAGPNGALEPLPAGWHNGYEVTPTGVYLALTSAITSGASLVKLLPDPTYSLPGLPEWRGTIGSMIAATWWPMKARAAKQPEKIGKSLVKFASRRWRDSA